MSTDDEKKKDKKKKEKESFDKFSRIAPDLIPTSVNNEVPLARVKHAKWKQVVYTPTAIMQLSLPHKDPGNVLEWKVRNSEADVILRSGNTQNEKGQSSPMFLPYGWFPRFMLLWIQHHVQHTQERRIFLGRSIAQMLEKTLKLGRQTTNYKNVNLHFPRLLLSEMEIHQPYPAIHIDNSHPFQGEGEHIEFHRLVREIDRFGHQKHKGHNAYYLYLSEPFYDSIIKHPLPINMEHVRQLARDGNTYKLDAYTFLCERLPNIEQNDPIFINRNDIEDLFGMNISDKGKFYRDNFLKIILPSVQSIYPEANIEADKDGLTLRRSPPPTQELIDLTPES